MAAGGEARTEGGMSAEITEIKNRFTGAVIFSAKVEGATAGIRLGACVRLALAARANLADADLAGANLANADLANAYLAGAYLAGAEGILDCGTPYGWRVVVNVYGGAVRICAGCRSFTFKEAMAHWKNRDDRKLMLPLLAYIEAAAKINKWPLAAKHERRTA